MNDIKIIMIFDEIYELLKPEFISGEISVVGSTLNHLTGFNKKKDDSGDIDLIMDTREAELKFIEATANLSGTDVNVEYKPKNKHRRLLLKYKNTLIETFVDNPLDGIYTDIKYNGKTYCIYEQKIEDKLEAIFHVIIVLAGRVSTDMVGYKINPTVKTHMRIELNMHRVEKQFKNIDIHIEKCGIEYQSLNFYKTYVSVRQKYEYDCQRGLFYLNEKGRRTTEDKHTQK